MEQETRYQRVAREQRERQEARAKRMADAEKAARRSQRKTSRYSAEQRNADRIDGYDRDDLGASPDY